MAIVKMKKMQLVAMSYDKDAVLDAMQRTGAVEIVLHNATDNTNVSQQDTEELRSYFATVETALEALCAAVEKRQKEKNEKSDILKDGFDVSYSEFFEAKTRKAQTDALVEQIHKLLDEKNALKGELTRYARLKAQAEIYKILKTPFSAFTSTQHTQAKLGTLPFQNKENALTALAEEPLCEVKVCNQDSENALFYVVSHKQAAEKVKEILSAYSFTESPYQGNETGESVYKSLCEKELEITSLISRNEESMYALKEEIRALKVYCDYVRYTLEKAETDEKLRTTQQTFFLLAYLPEDAEESVKAAVLEVSNAAYMEFREPTDEDEPPTLLRNNQIVSNFESITNTYSTPNYREFDPNTVMSFFYSLFMGFIIGDAGYGVLMAVVGGLLWWKNRARPSGLSRLAGAFAVGGVFAVVWGLLFNSFFGIALFEKTFMPDPQKDMWSLAGIAVPSVLIISMVMGVFQLFVGYLCKAVQHWRRGEIADGIFDGVVWALFSVGMALLIVGFVDEANVPILGTVGAIMAGVTLLLAMVTAGRKEKFFGKFTKGFGTAYGVINYASDILSYARLYGLMLSGAVIAQIIAKYSGQFILSGQVPMVILGVLILVVGHGFNLVMNLLGAYIHDARLQYVEFYGRFFEGDGEPFKPLGSNHKYVFLTHSAKRADL